MVVFRKTCSNAAHRCLSTVGKCWFRRRPGFMPSLISPNSSLSPSVHPRRLFRGGSSTGSRGGLGGRVIGSAARRLFARSPRVSPRPEVRGRRRHRHVYRAKLRRVGRSIAGRGDMFGESPSSSPVRGLDREESRRGRHVERHEGGHAFRASTVSEIGARALRQSIRVQDRGREGGAVFPTQGVPFRRQRSRGGLVGQTSRIIGETRWKTGRPVHRAATVGVLA